MAVETESLIEETLDRLHDDPLRRLVRTLEGDPPATYLRTRNLLARGLCLIYLCAFAVVVTQAVPLLGEHGLLPARWHLDDLRAHHGSAGRRSLRDPRSSFSTPATAPSSLPVGPRRLGLGSRSSPSGRP